jgi:putative membrane protein
MAVAAAILAGGGVRAETQPGPPKPRIANPAMFAPAAAASSKRMTDQQREEWRFLKEAAAAGRFEIEASRLAVAKSSNAGIRSFAATLIKHHTSVSNELVHMLHVRGMAPPMLANDQRKTLNRLAKLQGKKFDREFMDEVGLKRQQEDVQLFERARVAAGDPQLKAWIERMLPTLRNNMTAAERLAPSPVRSG